MKKKRDCYEVLGLPKTSSTEEIKSTYRKLALKYHPDKNPDDPQAEQKFKEAAEAYEILSNPEKRNRYDRFGHAGLSGHSGFNNVSDIFSAFGDIFESSIFEDIFGFGGFRGRASRRGNHLRCRVTLEFADPAKEVEKTIELKRREPCVGCKGTGCGPGTSRKICQTCGGRGVFQQIQGFFSLQTTCPDCRGQGSTIEKPCKECQGKGHAYKAREIKVKIPAGVDNGMQIRLNGEGESLEANVPRGDLYCEIDIKPHPIFERRGDDVVLQFPITFTQAALGAKVEIPTIYGKTKLTIPPGTQNDEILKLRTMGFPNLRGRGKGDQLILIVVEVPKKLTKEQRQILQEFAGTEETNITPMQKSFWDKVSELFSLNNDEGEKRNEG